MTGNQLTPQRKPRQHQSLRRLKQTRHLNRILSQNQNPDVDIPVPVPIGQRPEDYFGSNNDLYEQDLMNDLLPFLEANFSVRIDAAGRSIAGLSMGGGHAIDTGLKHVQAFSSIGAFSAATPQLIDEDLIARYPSLTGPNPAANKLKNVWIPIGASDFLLQRNEKFVEQLNADNVNHIFLKTSGGHEWKLWREYLPEFLKMSVGRP